MVITAKLNFSWFWLMFVFGPLKVGIIQTKTLALLQKQGVSPNRVYIFVADAVEYEKYRRAIGKDWPNIVIGVRTLWRQRNFITEFFREGTHIVSRHLLSANLCCWFWVPTVICCAICVAFLACARHMCVQLMWSPVSQRQKNMYHLSHIYINIHVSDCVRLSWSSRFPWTMTWKASFNACPAWRNIA